jgi:hypothetical protein
VINEWILFKNYFFDRIYRINWIFSRFPDETVKTASAYRRKSGDLLSKIRNAAVCLFIMHRSGDLTLAITISAKRIANTRFHPETGYLKNPNNPVNPV